MAGSFGKIRFSPDGEYLITNRNGNKVFFWGVSSGVIEREITCDGLISGFDISPDGHLVVAGRRDAPEVEVRDAASGALVQTLTGHSDALIDVSFSPDGSHVASPSYDATARIWRRYSR